jgi:hypothetical protein
VIFHFFFSDEKKYIRFQGSFSHNSDPLIERVFVNYYNFLIESPYKDVIYIRPPPTEVLSQLKISENNQDQDKIDSASFENILLFGDKFM